MTPVNIKSPYGQWNQLFSPEELAAIDTYVTTNIAPQRGSVGVSDTARLNENVRKSTIYWIYLNESTQWIFERINAAGFKLNSHIFGFDIRPLQRLQYTVYEDTGGHYDWHWDCFIESGMSDLVVNYQRKLSLVVMCQQANEGGQLQITLGSDCLEPEMPEGNAVAFPSFILHRVVPVTSGTRKTLVAWFEGPDWR